ncbi:MAG: cupin domain-containing protein [Pyrinomonadaceae bacterium]
MKKIIRFVVLFPVLAIVGYLVFGIGLCWFLKPSSKRDLSNYFRPGDHLVSRFEGFDQTILSIKDGWLHTRLEIKPHAVGPPEHFHEAITENFTVKIGTLSILVNGEQRTLKSGETITIPPMTRHRPFNETDETVIVESDDPKTLPVEFGYLLTQLYGFMDEYPEGPNTPQILMQLSVYGSDADSWIADGPPLVVQKAMRTLLEPTARLLGYKENHEEYRPKSQP